MKRIIKLIIIVCLTCIIVLIAGCSVPHGQLSALLTQVEQNILTRFYRNLPLIEMPDVCDDDSDIVYYDVPLSYEIQDYISELCQIYKVPARVIYAIIKVESNFNANLISKTDDYGLMQINKCNHQWLREQYEIEDFLNTYDNIKSGIIIFSSHHQKYPYLSRALMAYNMGAYGAKRAWDKGISSTRYTDKIFKALKEIKEIQ